MKLRSRFTPDWIQKLKESISLTEIVGENVELKKSGNRFMGRCPFHGDRSPSFSVNKDFYYCFGCKETGDAIAFVMKLHGLSFEEACEDLAEKANLTIPEAALDSAEEQALYQRRKRIQEGAKLNYFASLKYYHQNLVNGRGNPAFDEAREYLKKRGVRPETIELFQIGVAGAQADGLTQFLSKAKAPLPTAREIGLILPSQKHAGDYDFFRERILFPLIDARGRVCGFGGRILPSADARPSDKKQPKYKNSADSDLYKKSNYLYGFYQAKLAIREEETAILVEGYFDVIGLYQAGIKNVVAPGGTSLTDEQLKMLSRLAKRLIVFFDQDEAGIEATQKSMVLALKSGMLLYGIEFESKLDPDEFILEDPENNVRILKEKIAGARPLLDMMIDKLMERSHGDVEARSQAIKQITQWLTLFADPVGRALRVQQLQTRYQIPVQALGGLGGLINPIAPKHPSGALGAPLKQGSQPTRRRVPISPSDRQLLQFFVKFESFGAYFQEAKKQMHEKDTLSDLFHDTEIQQWVKALQVDPTGLSRLKHAPESCIQEGVSQELRSVIMEGLLSESVAGEGEQLAALLRRGVYKAWARFSHKLKADMLEADSRQDMEKFKELSQQFLDLQRKLKEFEDSYVSGKND